MSIHSPKRHLVLLLAVLGALSAGEPQTHLVEPEEGDAATQLSNLTNASVPEMAKTSGASIERDPHRPVNTMLRYGEYCGPGPELVSCCIV